MKLGRLLYFFGKDKDKDFTKPFKADFAIVKASMFQQVYLLPSYLI